jgi:hydrogenase maturation protease
MSRGALVKTSAWRVHVSSGGVSHRDGRQLLAVIGIGNRFRRDDAAGLEVACRLRAADEALVIDAFSSGAEPGTVHRFEAAHAPLPVKLLKPSTHALGVTDAIELARELDRLPPRLTVYGIEGADFAVGEGLTKAVRMAVDGLVAELYEERIRVNARGARRSFGPAP